MSAYPSTKVITISGTAKLSEDLKYRFWLRRELGLDNGKTVTFVMLNPSTADHSVDDPTIRRCLGFARDWGCWQLQVVNLFAIRSSSPKVLAGELKTGDPSWVENKMHLNHCVRKHHVDVRDIKRGPIVCAWGSHKMAIGRAAEVTDLLAGTGLQLMCLGTTDRGHPRHPLYTPAATRLVPYIGPI